MGGKVNESIRTNNGLPVLISFYCLFKLVVFGGFILMKYKASPGSKAAIAMGCICPSKDNNNGMGFILSGHKVFYMRDDCPIHSANTLQEYVNRRVLEGAHEDDYDEWV